MNSRKLFVTLYLFIMPILLISQTQKTDANIIGHVVGKGEHLKFANIIVVGTTIGCATDETGHYSLINLPLGKITLKAQALGFKPEERTVILEKNKTVEVKFELERDVLGMEQVVVTSDRNETNRAKASTIVNTLTPKLFENTQSNTFAEALNFTPGLRTENNCENCGFSQVRMNGLEGPYSQILINGRQIFSGLAGVYGLEIIPTNMIERVEVTRGGSSALYGSNAIAGTINLLLKDPIKDSYEIGTTAGLVGVGVDGSGDAARDNSVNFNTSIVAPDYKTGLALFGFYRDRNDFDANNDSFSEMTRLKNITIGGRLFHRFTDKNKLSLDFFHINEDRRGGDRFDYPLHEANIAEALNHNITTGAFNYEQFFRKNDLLSVYGAGQFVDRDSYYGAGKSLKDYGKTKDFSYSLGVQYNLVFNQSSKLIFGAENNSSSLEDKKLGYLDYENAVIENGTVTSVPHTDNVLVADQTSNIVGAFAQYEIELSKFKISLGGRYDHYSIEDVQNNSSKKTGDVFSPRVNVLYNFAEHLQARISFSQGYRAPQIFDEDLHIETSGSRKVIHKNAPNLEQETSNSFMASLDFNKLIGKTYFGFLAEGFYTKLENPFVNEYGEPDAQGTVIYTRINAEKGAVVKGVNLESNIVPSYKLNFQLGFTIQSSEYEEEQEFSEKRFFRTPDSYGYFTVNWDPTRLFGISATGNYTGSMLVPFFGVSLPDPDAGVLRESDPFFDLGLKLKYNFLISGRTLQLFGGVKNILNSYQDDFDIGEERDPAYIYGPISPRTIYFGIKIGNDI